MHLVDFVSQNTYKLQRDCEACFEQLAIWIKIGLELSGLEINCVTH
jgi:hypothetical protein